MLVLTWRFWHYYLEAFLLKQVSKLGRRFRKITDSHDDSPPPISFIIIPYFVGITAYKMQLELGDEVAHRGVEMRCLCTWEAEDNC